MNPILSCIGSQYSLYDADVLCSAKAELFDVEHHRDQGMLQGDAQGRGRAWFISLQEDAAVLRHYRRGGWMRILGDRYLWTGLERTRALREWRLLAELSRLGLPVPRPLAARVVRRGIVYRADIITRRIESSHSLAATLQTSPLSLQEWSRLGRCIRRFHDAGVYHADLNAQNILLVSDGGIYLIDFDRGKIKDQGQGWKRRNLARLLRSLTKFSCRHSHFAFNPVDFEWLKRGYYNV
jgi:3-deoxy-D-manno-octulosonic acid kinase